MNDIEKILGIGTIDLGEEATREMRETHSKFPVGTEVVFDLPVESPWDLSGVTGRIQRHTEDPTRPLIIEIDYPSILPLLLEEALEPAPVPKWAIEYSKRHKCPVDSGLASKPWKRRVSATGDSVKFRNEYTGELNYGLGATPTLEDICKAKFTRAWEWLADWAESDIEYYDLAMQFDPAGVGE